MDQIKDFGVLIEPILLYGSPAWGTHKGNDLTLVYNKFHKSVLKVKASTPTYMWLLETGSVPLRAKMDFRMISYWASLMCPKLKSERLARSCYEQQRKEKYKSWSTDIKDILYRHGMGLYWENQRVPNKFAFVIRTRRREFMVEQ